MYSRLLDDQAEIPASRERSRTIIHFTVMPLALMRILWYIGAGWDTFDQDVCHARAGLIVGCHAPCMHGYK